MASVHAYGPYKLEFTIYVNNFYDSTLILLLLSVIFFITSLNMVSRSFPT